MPTKPLQPFAPPTSLTAFLPNGFNSSEFVIGFLIIVGIFWLIYTLVAIYHWMKYSHGSWIAMPAIVVHLGISLALIVYAVTDILFL